MTLDEIKKIYFSCSTLKQASKALKMEIWKIMMIRDENKWPKLNQRDPLLNTPRKGASLYDSVITDTPLTDKQIARIT